MSVIHPIRKGIVAAIVAIVMNSIPLAEQTADSQDEAELLAALLQADSTEAKRLERQLQRLWSRSGSASMELLLKRGQDALETEDYTAAIGHLTALTDHAPDFAEGWNARASAFFHSERYGLALSDLETALSLNPNNYTAIFGLGTILEELGQDDLAFRAYERAKSIHPHFEDVTKAMDRLRSDVEGESL